MGHREEVGMFYSDNEEEEDRVGEDEDEEDDTPQVGILLYEQMSPLKGKILL